MPKTTVLPLTPAEFRATVLSHGWTALEPFALDDDGGSVTVAFDLPVGKGIVTVRVEGERCVMLPVKGSRKACERVASAVLALDLDLADLHSRATGDWAWIAANGMGRFLRSPSLFEDLCKTLFATHIRFSGTVKMSAAAVSLGQDVGGVRAFPRPERLLELGDAGMRSALGCGFRARYLMALCECAAAEPDLYLGDAWRKLTPVEFTATVHGLLGFGPSAVGYLARMYAPGGDHHYDSWVLKRCEELWGVSGGEMVALVEDRYHAFGNMGPTVMWLELTREWHDAG